MSSGTHTQGIFVINRRNERIHMNLMTISTRLKLLANMQPPLSISTDYVAAQTASKLINNIHTSEIDNISANICASLISEDPEYDILATRIAVSDLHKNTHEDIRRYAEDLKEYTYRSRKIKILHPTLLAFIDRYHKEIDMAIDHKRDYQYNYFGIVTMIKSYLLSYKLDGDVKITKERPQQMLMRVAIGINMNLIDADGSCSTSTLNSIMSTYSLLSGKYYTHATPTLFNAGTVNHTLSSCYLLSIDDNLDNIYDRLSDISKISKFSGGVGIHTSMVRAHDSVIGSTIGRAEGLVPMLRVFNESTKYVSQGGGKRKGSTAVYLEPWHADIESCLNSQRNQGTPELLCKDLFLALWIPDLFMERLKMALQSDKDIKWSLMCPNECPGLTESYGDDFKRLYEKYEKDGMFRKQMSVLDLWKLILSLQIETGKPYVMYKDHVNRKCNQNNLGVIKSSNLCVSGDTPILTDQGYRTVANLSMKKTANVWNGKRFTNATFAQTSDNAKLYLLEFNDGTFLKCTGEHRFSLANGDVKEAQDLVEHDELETTEMPIVKNEANAFDLKRPYYAATSHKNQDDLSPVPISASYKCRKEWFGGMIDIYGNMLVKPEVDDDGMAMEFGYQYLELQLPSYQFAYKVLLLSNTLGLSPSIKMMKDKAIMTFTSYDTMKIFVCLEIETFGLKLVERDDALIQCDYQPVSKHVVSKTLLPGTHSTYCFNEPILHKGVFNGVYAMNCSEITIYSDTENVGVCNLASICLPKFLSKSSNGEYSFDYQHLMEVAQKVCINMNKVIDNNKYPIPEAKHSDDLNRPIGIGTQGLAEVFMIMGEPFDSPRAREINKNIFETIYYGALLASNKLAKVHGKYKTFDTSMTAKGVLQYDLWGVKPSSGLWDWDEMKQQIKENGLRNSLLLCQMPTAGTSIILGHTESVEVPQSNVYTRSTLSGRFQVINKHLVKELKKLNMWNEKVKQDIINNNGSVAGLMYIPHKIRDVFKTVFEYKISSFIEMCADREAYICQSSSNNRFVMDPTISKLTKMHLYSWKLGIKTSSYYLRVKAVTTGKKLGSGADSVYSVARSHRSRDTRHSISSYAPTVLSEDDDVCESCSA